MLQIRDAVAEDQVHLIDCDIKCFDMVWQPDAWAVVADSQQIRVATHNETPIGFCTYVFDTEKREIHVPKIGVKPTFRRRGVGTALLCEPIHFARHMGVTTLLTLIPESLLRPKEPQDITGWLQKTGWRATGKIHRDFYPYMGSREGAVVFTLLRGQQ